MKKILFVGLLVLAILLVRFDEAFAKLPANFQEFKARYQKEALTPEGAAHMYFEAVFCYLDENTRSEGGKMLRYSLHYNRPIEQFHTRTFVERLKDKSYHHIFRSFAVGSTPDNNYKMSPDNFKLQITNKRKEENVYFLSLRSSGADSDRLVTFVQYDGLWYTFNNGSTFTQIRPPKSEVDAHRNDHDADFDVEEPPKPANEKTSTPVNEKNIEEDEWLDSVWN
jgi:hypothetical protein